VSVGPLQAWLERWAGLSQQPGHDEDGVEHEGDLLLTGGR
jgi:hypothetical protein